MATINEYNLWNDLHGKLISFVYSKVKDHDTAMDIVQEVFIKSHTRLSQLKEADKITGWIYQITRNAIADHYRSLARQVSPIEVESDDEVQSYNDCVGQCLQVLLGTLPDAYRVPLELTETENLSQLQVAQRLNISYSGARSRVQRARKMLREKFEALFIIKSDAYGNIIVCEDRQPCCCPTENC